MNVGIVTVWGDRGASVVSKSYIEILKHKFDIFIYSRGGEESIRERGDRNNNVYLSTTYKIPITTYLNKEEFIGWVKRNNIEIVIFNEQHWFEPLLWLKELKIKTFTYVDYYTEETIPLFALYDGVICNTKRHYEIFKKMNSLYFKWGVNLELYSRNWHKKNKCLTFFHSCGMNPMRKGTDILLKSAINLTGDFKIIIHSQKKLSSYYKDDEDVLLCIATLIKEEKLEVIEETIKAPGLYYRGDVYVYPCRLDGLGLTVPEALASGLPCIVPNFEPMTDFISPDCKTVSIDRIYARKDGYYWPQHICNIESLTYSMQGFINSKDSISEIQTRVRQHAVENLNWESNSIDLNDFILTTNFNVISDREFFSYEKFNNSGYRKCNKYFSKFSKLFHLINSFR